MGPSRMGEHWLESMLPRHNIHYSPIREQSTDLWNVSIHGQWNILLLPSASSTPS
jgi:hypothetical protein